MSHQSLSCLVILDFNTLIDPHCTENQSRFDALVSHVMPLRKRVNTQYQMNQETTEVHYLASKQSIISLVQCLHTNQVNEHIFAKKRERKSSDASISDMIKFALGKQKATRLFEPDTTNSKQQIAALSVINSFCSPSNSCWPRHKEHASAHKRVIKKKKKKP